MLPRNGVAYLFIYVVKYLDLQGGASNAAVGTGFLSA